MVPPERRIIAGTHVLDSCAVPRIPSLFVVCALGATSAAAGTVTGRVELLEKGGRAAQRPLGRVVYVDGPKAKGKPGARHR